MRRKILFILFDNDVEAIYHMFKIGMFPCDRLINMYVYILIFVINYTKSTINRLTYSFTTNSARKNKKIIYILFEITNSN